MQKVDKDYRAPEIEAEVKRQWAERSAYAKAKERRASSSIYSFIDGPPYTTGSVHVGTAWNKILKDLYLRYKRMKGFNVRDQPGYDMHGLPIEVKVEQAIGTKNKKDIEAFGVEKFIERCKSFAVEFRDKQTEEFKQLGVWMDWDNPYQTIDRPFISAVWWTLSEAYKKGLVTKANRVLPWCPRCETALAEAEIEYWDETDPSIYVRFPLLDTNNESIVIWTTTPWTIPGNVAAAVHPDEIYSKVMITNSPGQVMTLIVMKSLVEPAMAAMGIVDYQLVGEVKGSELLGKKYKHPLLDIVPFQSQIQGDFVHTVVTSDTVIKENTGIVHIAPGHGPEDFEIGKKYGLPTFCPVDEGGVFTKHAGEKYAGKSVQESGKDIMNDLQDRGLLLKEATITHRYGHCWRCKTPIIYRTTDQWFLQIPTIKDSILKTSEDVRWYPEWAGSGRQKDWIVNARDWCISRQRYWGTPMPIWQCECGERKVAAGYDDLKEGDGFFEGMDLHRPYIDNVTFKCPKCGGRMTRVPDVMDVWIDSGACSWASMAYPEKKSEFERWWPSEWITEAHDQTRGWFYSQLVLGTMVFGKSPFKSVLMHGWALDPQGRPMSKSEGTAVDPIGIIRSAGADSLRLYLLGASAPWDDLSFQPDGPKQANRFLNTLWNVYKFATLYMSIDAFNPRNHPIELYRNVLKPEDRWVLSRLENVKAVVTSSLDRFVPHEAERALEKFIGDDVSRWYVRLIRDRLWIEGDSAEKTSAFAVLHKVLLDSTLMLAPFAPHIVEELYQNLDGTYPTIHMADWPEIEREYVDEAVEQGMELVREIVEKISNARQSADLNLRWPMKRIILKADADDIAERLLSLKEVLLSQINAKEMQTIPVGEEWEEMVLTVVPNPNAIGKVYRQWASKIAVLLKSRPAKTIKEGVEKGSYSIGIEGQLVTIEPNMVSFTTEMPVDIIVAKFSHGEIYMDMELNEDLEAEGYSRETVRRIQQMRKEMKLDVEEYIGVEIQCSDKLQDYLKQWRNYLSHETRARDMEFVVSTKGDYIVEWSVEQETFTIGVTNLRIKEKIGDLGQITGLPLEKAIKLKTAGYENLQQLAAVADGQLLTLPGIDRNDLGKIRGYLAKKGVVSATQVYVPVMVQQQAQAPAQAEATKQPAAQSADVAVQPSQPAGTTIVIQPTVVQTPSQEVKIKVPIAAQISPVPAVEPSPPKTKMMKGDSAVLEKSFTYLVEENQPETSYKLLVNELNVGMKGFCVTRNYPAKIRSRFNLGDTQVFWLSNVGKDDSIRPKDLEKLSLSIEQFLSHNGVAILLDGLEYLITNNNFITVLRLLQSLRDQVAIHQSVLIIAVNPSTLESHQLNLLEREVDGVIQG